MNDLDGIIGVPHRQYTRVKGKQIMNQGTIQTADAMSWTALNDESKLCFGAAAGCFVIGIIGWLINLALPETTLLHGLLVVAGFYCVLGVVNIFKAVAAPSEDDSTIDEAVSSIDKVESGKKPPNIAA